jgi:HK97 family phage major capsid protein
MTVTAKPSLGELEAMLRDPVKMKEMSENGKLADYFNDREEARMEAMRVEVQNAADQQLKTIVDMIKDTGGVARKVSGGEVRKRGDVQRVARGKGVVYNAKAPGAKIDELDDEFRPEGFSEFLQAISGRRDELATHTGRDLGAMFGAWKTVRNSFGTTIPSDGGFLVPEELRSELLSNALESSIVRPRAQVIPMSSQVVPIPVVDETTHASTVFGGIVAYWTEEGAAATESSAKFGRVRLDAKKLVIYCEAPNELMADSVAFEAWLSSNLPAAAAWFEDDKYLNGSGVGEPLGVLGSGANTNPALIGTTRNAGGNAIEYQDIANVYARLLPGSYANAVWVCSPAVIGQLLQITTGTGGVPLWLTGGQFIEGAPTQILGRPLFVTEKVPNVGTQGDLSLLDFSKYIIGDRQTLQAKQSEDFKFSSDITAFRLTERVDGRPGLLSALTPKNGGSTLSPFVTVAT